MGRSLPVQVLLFLQWLKQTEGRDKLYRLVAYGSKVPIHLLKEGGGDKDLIQRLSKGASAVGLTRKLMRVFRSVEFLNDLVKATEIKDNFERNASFVKAFALMWWMIADHTQWMAKAGYLTLTKDQQSSVDRMHSKAWFVGLLAGVVISLYKLVPIMDQLRVARSGPADAKAVDELESKQRKTVQGLVKNAVDLIIPTARLKWVDVSDLAVGLAGTFTSIIGIIDTYPAALK